jgi:hypothetical protein
MRIPLAALMACLIALPLQLRAQSLDTVGARAQGMGGAFVGVADDASAVYWNPAGLAGGAYFSLVIDGNTAEAIPDGLANASARSGWLLALSTPALGLSYTRTQTTLVRPAIGIPENSRVESLLTQHVGGTFVQSIVDQLAVGATVKLIRGIAAAANVAGTDRERLLDDVDLIGHGSNTVDVDIGLMAVASFGRAGLTIRNVTEPSFETGTGEELPLQRQARAGGSILLLPNWKVAADLDLLETDGPYGDFREVSLGSEGQVTRRLAARAGVRFNTAGDVGGAPAASVGGSYAIMGSVQIDGQYTGGSDKALRGWGIAGRVVF